MTILSLTLNAIFEKTFGKYRTPGTGLDYAAQFKFAVVDGISAGAELRRHLDLGDVPSFNDTEFRVGPVLYLSWRSDQSPYWLHGRHRRAPRDDGCNPGHDDQMTLELTANQEGFCQLGSLIRTASTGKPTFRFASVWRIARSTSSISTV